MKRAKNKLKENNKENKAAKVKQSKQHRAEQKEELPFQPSAFKNRTVLKMPALNKERFFNALLKEKIRIYKISEKGGFVYFIIDDKDKAKTFAISDNLCYNIDVCLQTGAKNVLKTIFMRIGLPIGLIFFSALALFFNGYVWRIEISGNHSVDSVLIQRALEENNIKVGARKNFDTKSASLKLNEMEGIEDSTIRVVGTTVKVVVVESTPYKPPDNEYKTSIVSDFDGVVTRIIVNSGTAAVKIGDVVKKGDVLIKGEFVNQAGESVAVNADGAVFGKISFSEHTIRSTCEQTVVYSPARRKTCLSFFGIRIGKLKAPEGCEVVVTSSKFCFVPIKVTTLTYREVKTVEIKKTLDQLKEECEKEARLKHGITSGEVKVTERQIGENVYRISVYITAEVKLA